MSSSDDLFVSQDSARIYRPLIPEDGFRILRLQPSSNPSTQVQGTLEHTSLSAYTSEIIDNYTALSYVWGDPNELCTISVDGYLFQITASLECALRHLRDEERMILVWADALCINQDDTPEKNLQVQRMGSIYSHASHTVIFLDESSNDLDAAILGNRFLVSSKAENVNYRNLSRSKQESTVVTEALLNLLSRPWFTRVWILQELVMSRDPLIQCGKTRIKWKTLCDMVSTTLETSGFLSTNVINIRQGRHIISSMDSTRNKYHYYPKVNESDLDMLSLVISRRAFGVSDGRDMIYAHMGIASDAFKLQHSLKIDYNKTISKVYEELAIYWLRNGVNIFDLLADTDPAERRPGLQSWVPDWQQKPANPLPMFRRMGREVLAKASSNSRNAFSDTREKGDRPSALIIHGHFLGKITHIRQVFPTSSQLEQEARSIYDYLSPDTDLIDLDISLAGYQDRINHSSNLKKALTRLTETLAKAAGLVASSADFTAQLSRQEHYSTQVLYEGIVRDWQATGTANWEDLKARPLHYAVLNYLRGNYNKDVIEPPKDWLYRRRLCVLEHSYHPESTQFPSQCIIAPLSTQADDIVVGIDSPGGLETWGTYVLREAHINVNKQAHVNYIVIGKCFVPETHGDITHSKFLTLV